jgi:hypothetical protein
LADVRVRVRTSFAYVDGVLPDGEVLPLCRLRYGGSASFWGFAIYTGSGNRYESSVLPSGMPIGEPHEALDCACGLSSTIPRPGYELLPSTTRIVISRRRRSAGSLRLA